MAALGSIGSALILVTLKVFLALATGSLGVLSEALHSGLDLIAAILTWLSVRISDRPADSGHTYGHGKFESFSAFVETGLLLATSVYIIFEAFVRLLFKQVRLQPSALAIMILGIAMGIDVIRSRALARVAREFPSEALEADALHFSTDVWSTFVVILGMAAVWIGQYTGITWLRDADPIAALVGRGHRDLGGLAPRKTNAGRAAGRGARRLAGAGHRSGRGARWRDLHRTRPRAPRREPALCGCHDQRPALGQLRAGARHFRRCRKARRRNRSRGRHGAHGAPRRRGRASVRRIRAIAARRGLAVHEISADQLDGRLFVEMHLEVPEQLSLRDAHRRATELEEEIRMLPGVAASSERIEPVVNIHIEPLGTHIASVDGQRGEMTGLGRAIEKYINTLPKEYHELVDCHEVHVRQVEHKILASCHCAMDGNLPITQIHDVTAALEDRVKEKFPQVARVTIHPEPVEER